jgi:hypothetical protein
VILLSLSMSVPTEYFERDSVHARSSFCFILKYYMKIVNVKVVEVRINQIQKGSDGCVKYSELLGFWTLSIIRYSRN